jgi:diguanylate cyclase (GGDEF)-like protein/PAS domain S-box-containing protein
MKKFNCKKILEDMSIAFAYNKVIYDKKNEPKDFIVLKINNKLKEITEFENEDVIQKKGSNILKNIIDEPSVLIKNCGKVASSGKDTSFEICSKITGNWYEVKVFSEKEGYFTAAFNDITERKQKEYELKKKTENLNNILNNLNDVIWTMRWSDQKINFISKKFKDIIGYSREEMKDDHLLIRKITHPDDKDIHDEAMEKLKQNGYAEREFRIITKDGSIKWLYDRASLIKDENNNILRAEGIMRDITKRKIAENKLKYSHKMYETIFNSTPIGIIIENKNGDIIEVNEAECEITGYTKDELEGSNVIDKFVLPQHHELAKDNIKNILEGQDIKIDIETPKKNGDIAYMHLKETNITFPDGTKGIISMHIDVTERIKKEEKIKEQRDRMEYILKGTDAGTWEWNLQTGETVINDKWAEMIGYNLEDITPFSFETWEKFTHPDDLEKSEKMLEKHIKGEKEQYKTEIRMRHKKGYWVWFLVKGKVVSWTDDGKPLKMFGVHLDITQIKNKEEKIKYLSYNDKLTNLYNRRFFEEELKRLDTKRQLPISIVMADVNGLKIINDSQGHQIGDQILIKTGNILNEELREEDILARYGGDEFTILLPQTSYEQTQKIISRLKSKNNKKCKEGYTISFSLGFSTKEMEDEDIYDVLKKADDNMYQNKLSENRSNKNKIVKNLLNTLAAKSSETKEHSMRMTKLARQLGDKLRLSNKILNKLSLIATLHDIGKTNISEEILIKPGKLTKKEWKIIKEHPLKGYKIASASEEFALVAREILSHHEHWNGNGYPEGLKGEDIPYLARIISIIDAYDVMTNERPYSKAISNEEALAEIKECAGKQFDPKLVKEFIELLENKR